jgi:glycosyltransferase involved in cell wall biosynthesis
LLPSVGEGFPLVVQEAMCSGLPCVVSTDVAVGCPEIIDKYILAGPAGVGAEQAILRYLDNPMTWEDRRNLAAQAREMWSWYRCAEEYEALFMEVVARAN